MGKTNLQSKAASAVPADDNSPSTSSDSNSQCSCSTNSDMRRTVPDPKPTYNKGKGKATASTGEMADPHYISEHIRRMHQKIKVNLVDDQLWKKFRKIGNEMIVTKPGRRLYPGLMVSLRGLEPTTYYDVSFRATSYDECRYKYLSMKWENVGESEVMQNEDRQIYKHPNSPNSGLIWMKKPVSFKSVKITHHPTSKNGNILLHTMHKYLVEIVIVPYNTSRRATYSELSFPLEDTTFLAVSAYQNLDLTQLKIDNNPFAKGFRDKMRAAKETRAQQQQQQQQHVDQASQCYPYSLHEYNMQASMQPGMQAASYGLVAPPLAPPTSSSATPAFPANNLTNGFSPMLSPAPALYGAIPAPALYGAIPAPALYGAIPAPALGGAMTQYPPIYHPIPTYPNLFPGFNIPRMSGDGTLATPTTGYGFPRMSADGTLIAPSTMTPPNSAPPMATTPMAGPPLIGVRYPVPASVLAPRDGSRSINVVDDIESTDEEGE